MPKVKHTEYYTLFLPPEGKVVELHSDYKYRLWVENISLYENDTLIESIPLDVSYYYENAKLDDVGRTILGELTNYYPIVTKFIEINHIVDDKLTLKVSQNTLSTERKICIRIIDAWFDSFMVAEIEIIQAGK